MHKFKGIQNILLDKFKNTLHLWNPSSTDLNLTCTHFRHFTFQKSSGGKRRTHKDMVSFVCFLQCLIWAMLCAINHSKFTDWVAITSCSNSLISSRLVNEVGKQATSDTVSQTLDEAATRHPSICAVSCSETNSDK